MVEVANSSWSKLSVKYVLDGRRRLNTGQYESAYRKFLKAADAEMARYLRHTDTPQCAEPGCARCCRTLMVVSSKAERAFLKRMVSTRTPRDVVKARAEDECARIDEATAACGLSGYTRSGLGAISALYVQLGGRCPLLHNDVCLIYEDRPLSCRTFVGHQRCSNPYNRIMLLGAVSRQFHGDIARSGSCHEPLAKLIHEWSQRWAP